MKKIHITLLIILSSVFFSAGATAQNKPLACQSDARAGLIWETGRWVVNTFSPKRFILVQTKDGLTVESVAKALGTVHLADVLCRENMYRIICSEGYGETLYFDPKTLKGGISSLYGAIEPDKHELKDTVTVTAFSCTAF
jgi:hypothetical protein